MARRPRRTIPYPDRNEIWRDTDGQCFYCGIQTSPWDSFCVDHMQPLSRGGSDDHDNLVPCCRECNAHKHAMTVDEFRDWATRYYPRLIRFTMQETRGWLSIGRPEMAPNGLVFWHEGVALYAIEAGLDDYDSFLIDLPDGRRVNVATYERLIGKGLFVRRPPIGCDWPPQPLQGATLA